MNKYKKYVEKYHETHPKKIILSCCKQRAKRLGINFDLTEEDIELPEKCLYLDVPLTYIRGKGRQFSNMSIDRIDSSKGYVKGNIQIISDLANRMKQNATPEQLVAFAKGVMRIYND